MPIPITIGQIPMSFTTDQANFIQTLVNAINLLQTSVLPPNAPSALKVTPTAGGNLIQFTRSNGDSYSVYRNTVNTPHGAVRFDIGLANTYNDVIGTSGAKYFYWIKAKLGQLQSTLVGPVAGTTLGLNVSIVQPAAVAPSQNPTQSDLESAAIPGSPVGIGPFNEDL